MRTVRIDKEELKDIVEKNRDGHRAEFEKAIAEYRKAIVTELDRLVQRIKDGKLIDHYIRLPQPEDHTKDYDQVVEMLELSVDSSIELTNTEFAQYVRDDWGWKEAFTTSNKTLTAYNNA